MLRLHALSPALALLLVMGCGDDGGGSVLTGATSAGTAPTATATMTATATDGTGDGTSDTSAGDSPTTATATATTDPTTATATATASTSGGETGSFIDPGDEADSGGGGGAYEPCMGGMCTTGSCLTADPPNDSRTYCAPNCSPAGDPSGCPPAPDGDTMPICIDVGDMMGGMVSSYCALDCSGGQTCPTGMMCLMDSDQNGPITVCI